jgi:hypothetical protein
MERMSIRTVVAVGLVGVAAGLARAQTPSLAEIARAEESRRAAIRQPAKVYTNDDLRPDFTRPTPPAPPASAGAPASENPGPAGEQAAAASGHGAPPAASPAAGGQAGAASPPRDQAYWGSRMTQARAQLERSQTFAQALQNRVDALWTDFVNRDNPVERAAIEQDRIKALDELARVKKEIDEQTKAIAAIQEEARRANVPAGWLRP